MLRHSRPLRGRRDRFVNGYNLIGGDTETEEEITPEQQALIDKRLEDFENDMLQKRDENLLFYYILTPEEQKEFEIQLIYGKFNSYTFRHILGKTYLDILRARLDDLLKEVRTADNTDFLQDLRPFDKYYYAILKKKGLDNDEIEDIMEISVKPHLYRKGNVTESLDRDFPKVYDFKHKENLDQLVLHNTLEGYAARTEAGKYFTGGIQSGIKTNEVGWIGEYIFATEVYPKKYGNGNELPINTDKFIYRQTGYFGKWDFSDSTYSFEVKTQDMEKENPDALYYCQMSKLDNIPANVSKIALWWGKSPSPDKTINARTIKEWRYIEMDKNDIGDGKRYHYENDGFYDDNKRIAKFAPQAGQQYAANPVHNQIVFKNDTYLQSFTVSP